MFLLEMVENDICLRGASKLNALFSQKYALKNAPMLPMSRIGPVVYFMLNIDYLPDFFPKIIKTFSNFTSLGDFDHHFDSKVGPDTSSGIFFI